MLKQCPEPMAKHILWHCKEYGFGPDLLMESRVIAGNNLPLFKAFVEDFSLSCDGENLLLLPENAAELLEIYFQAGNALSVYAMAPMFRSGDLLIALYAKYGFNLPADMALPERERLIYRKNYRDVFLELISGRAELVDGYSGESKTLSQQALDFMLSEPDAEVLTMAYLRGNPELDEKALEKISDRFLELLIKISFKCNPDLRAAIGKFVIAKSDVRLFAICCQISPDFGKNAVGDLKRRIDDLLRQINNLLLQRAHLEKLVKLCENCFKLPYVP